MPFSIHRLVVVVLECRYYLLPGTSTRPVTLQYVELGVLVLYYEVQYVSLLQYRHTVLFLLLYVHTPYPKCRIS